jgi:SNF2 family DNA or RNA helicase
MGKKTDLVVWLKLTALQRHIYEAFLHSDAVKAALNSSKSPLAALTVLKKVCDHPALLSERATKLVVSGEGCAYLGRPVAHGIELCWPSWWLKKVVH